MSSKKIKEYLWSQPLISRYNLDGKKAKSKGNHIWNVDAKKLPGGVWVFRPYKRRIIGQPNALAILNDRYEWEPKVWDPQAASDTIKPTFSSPPGTLPPWLQWEAGTILVGIPTMETGPMPITTIADFIDPSGKPCTLETTFTLQVVRALPTLPLPVPMPDGTLIYPSPSYMSMSAYGMMDSGLLAYSNPLPSLQSVYPYQPPPSQ